MVQKMRFAARVGFIALIVLALSGCIRPAAPTAATADQTPADVAMAWFDLYLQLIPTTKGFSPPVVSRVLGYAGVTLYEAVVPGMPGYQSLTGQLSDLPPLPAVEAGRTYHWPTVANTALGEISHKFFAHATPEQLQLVAALEEEWVDEYQATLSPEVFRRSVLQGRLVAGAIYAWSQSDGSFDDALAYTSPAGDGLWLPTPPKALAALQPNWGNHRPFVRVAQECNAAPPPAYSTDPASLFYAEAQEVYAATTQLTTEQEAIAQFWADIAGETVTPSGHSISILSQVLRQKGATLDVAAVAYAKVGMAVADSFITCWRTKYQYNVLRPVTYIQAVIDPAWLPHIATPPFPEYTSGHSVQSAATAAVLTDLFGDNYAFTDRTHDARSLAPRSFKSFAEAAEEAAISRLYGGIHYRAAIENGLEQGQCIGARINALQMKQ